VFYRNSEPAINKTSGNGAQVSATQKAARRKESQGGHCPEAPHRHLSDAFEK